MAARRLVRFPCALKTRDALSTAYHVAATSPAMITFLSNMSRLASSTTFWASFVVLAVSYLVLVPYSTTIKQRSWILTTLSSAAMSLLSLPLLLQYAAGRGQLKYLAIPPVVADGIGRFFQAYLIVLVQSAVLSFASV